MVWFDTREKWRWFGLDYSGPAEMVLSGDAWSDSGNSGDVKGCMVYDLDNWCDLGPPGDAVCWWPTSGDVLIP